MDKKKRKELMEDPLSLDLAGTTSVVSATETTGLMGAMPPTQPDAAALNEIIRTHTPIVPKMGDGEIDGKKISPKK